MDVQNLKGFRDFLPIDARKREYVLNSLKKVFQSYGFEPLETPTLEYEENLTGKYGDEGDKIMYRFTDNGDRKVAMRYDQTVPLARIMAQYANDIPLPFKRYQIQNVFRAENTQRGRYREFLQVDIDTVGSASPLSDAEIIKLTIDSFKKLGFGNIKILVNDRKTFEGLDLKSIIIIDKLEKIGIDKVKEELEKAGESPNLIEKINKTAMTDRLTDVVNELKKLNISKDLIEFSPTLARGLDYYTGIIFEIKSNDYNSGSLGGGGRYDDLIGMFSKTDLPAVGFSFGIDRIIEAMDELKLFPENLDGTKILVTNTSIWSAKIAETVRSLDINAELYIDDKELDKQLRYADKKNIPYVLIVNKDNFELKNMKSGDKKIITLEELSDAIK